MVSSTLKKLFSSKLRVKVLSHFFFHPGETFYIRRMASQLRESAGSVARELKHLEGAGILSSRRIGNQRHYSLRHDSSIVPDLRNIFLKTEGVSAELKAALQKVAGTELAFIYGSYATGEAHAASDIDLMVIGDASDREVAAAIGRIERRLRRQINYTLFTRREAEKESGKQGEFIHEVLSGPKIVLLGSADDRLLRTA